MAVVTKYRIAEEAWRLIEGGDPSISSKINIEELKLAVGQIANTLLKADYLNVNLPMGEVIPNGAMVATYDNILVSQYKNISRSILPIKPLRLPRNMGVYEISDSSNVNSVFIPIEMGQAALLTGQPLLSDLLGQIGYSVYGQYVHYNRDLTIPNTTVTVTMRLVVMDISQYGDYDPLPILPEHEWQIKQELFKMFSQEPTSEELVVPSRQEKSTK